MMRVFAHHFQRTAQENPGENIPKSPPTQAKVVQGVASCAMAEARGGRCREKVVYSSAAQKGVMDRTTEVQWQRSK